MSFARLKNRFSVCGFSDFDCARDRCGRSAQRRSTPCTRTWSWWVSRSCAATIPRYATAPFSDSDKSLVASRQRFLPRMNDHNEVGVCRPCIERNTRRTQLCPWASEFLAVSLCSVTLVPWQGVGRRQETAARTLVAAAALSCKRRLPQRAKTLHHVAFAYLARYDRYT